MRDARDQINVCLIRGSVYYSKIFNSGTFFAEFVG